MEKTEPMEGYVVARDGRERIVCTKGTERCSLTNKLLLLYRPSVCMMQSEKTLYTFWKNSIDFPRIPYRLFSGSIGQTIRSLPISTPIVPNIGSGSSELLILSRGIMAPTAWNC